MKSFTILKHVYDACDMILLTKILRIKKLTCYTHHTTYEIKLQTSNKKKESNCLKNMDGNEINTRWNGYSMIHNAQ